MKKQKIICKILQWICILYILGMMYFTFFVNGIYDKYLIIGLLFQGPLLIWENKLSEAEDPLNLDKQKTALEYALEIKHGAKDDFVAKYGETLYEHFLKIGYIHQLQGTNCWEVTLRGTIAYDKHFAE